MTEKYIFHFLCKESNWRGLFNLLFQDLQVSLLQTLLILVWNISTSNVDCDIIYKRQFNLYSDTMLLFLPFKNTGASHLLSDRIHQMHKIVQITFLELLMFLKVFLICIFVRAVLLILGTRFAFSKVPAAIFSSRADESEPVCYANHSIMKLAK